MASPTLCQSCRFAAAHPIYCRAKWTRTLDPYYRQQDAAFTGECLEYDPPSIASLAADALADEKKENFQKSTIPDKYLGRIY